MFSDLPTHAAVVEAAALKAAHRLQRLDQKTLEMRRGTIWKKAKKVDNKSAMTKDHTKKWIYECEYECECKHLSMSMRVNMSVITTVSLGMSQCASSISRN